MSDTETFLPMTDEAIADPDFFSSQENDDIQANIERLRAEKANTKPARLDHDGFRAQLAQEVADAEKELTRDQKALEAAKQKVADLTADVEFDQMKVDSRTKGLDTFDRLRAKAAK